jgi:hypothetical protein
MPHLMNRCKDDVFALFAKLLRADVFSDDGFEYDKVNALARVSVSFLA